MSSFNQCTVTLNRSCNLRCSFCYAKDTGYINKDISLDDLKRIIEICDKENVRYLVFTGGEPTLYPHLFDAVFLSKKHGFYVSMSTNGILLDDYKYCKKLEESNIDYIDISLKGTSRIDFKKTTGKDKYLNVLNGIKNISHTKLNYNCSMVLTKDNIKTFCDGVDDIFNSGAKTISFTFEIDNSTKERGVEYLVSNNPFPLIENFILQIDRLNSITHGEWWHESSFPLCFYTEGQLKTLSNHIAGPCQVLTKTGFTFDEELNLIPCNMLFENRIGKLGKDFISHSQFNKYCLCDEKYVTATSELASLPSTKCSRCQYLDRCKGGCPIFWSHYSFDEFIKFKRSYYGC